MQFQTMLHSGKRKKIALSDWLIWRWIDKGFVMILIFDFEFDFEFDFDFDDLCRVAAMRLG